MIRQRSSPHRRPLRARWYFARDTHTVARWLLGKLLVRRWRGQERIVRVTEVESYVGHDDRACHAHRGMTARNAVMFGPAGCAYIYLIYGLYSCLNIVTEQTGFPAAVLVRGAVPVKNVSRGVDGPGKLCQGLAITRTLNGEDLTNSRTLWLADDGIRIATRQIITAPRIGVAYAGKDARLPWRYYIRDPNYSDPNDIRIASE